MSNSPILVIGATGKTGRRVARLLAARGHAVRPASRRAAVPFDWERPQTWRPALTGVRAAYVAFVPDLSVPGAEEAIGTLVGEARRAGVGRLVLLSGRGEAGAERCEAIVAASGLDHTLVRCAWFAQNFTEGEFRHAVRDGVIALPAGTVREPLVDCDDIAEVAVAALTDERHAGELYELTGPRLLGFDEVAAILAEAAGWPVTFAPVSLDEFHAGVAAAAGPEAAELLTAICRETLDGRNARLSDGVARALGREPTDFAEVCRRAAAAGAFRRVA